MFGITHTYTQAHFNKHLRQEMSGTNQESLAKRGVKDQPALSKKRTPPTVVRLRRTNKGIVQDCDVYIGRRWTYGGWDLPQSKWANPVSVKQCGSVEIAIQQFEKYIRQKPELLASLCELEGKALGCWCKPGPCHGDVLVRLFCERVN